MKLLMTADAVGGVWTYALDLARGLRAHGWETVLAVNGPPPSEPPVDVEVVVTRLPLDWRAQRPEEVAEAGVALARLAATRGADVVQLNSPAYAAGARFDAPLVGVQHSCPATWWRAVRGCEPWPDDFGWRRELGRRGLAACDVLVAPTAAFAAAVQREYWLAAAPVAVWNGRPPATAVARTSAEDCVFTAGRLWDESKGMAVLDAAAGRLGAPVWAAGPLAPPGGEAAAFSHLRTTDRLSAEALRSRLAGCAVFCSPSLYEPFGLAVLEAAQLGRPLALSDIPTFRELWDGAAVFTPPGDAAALAGALAALMADPARREALGEAARVRSARYTVARTAAAIADLLAGAGAGRG